MNLSARSVLHGKVTASITIEAARELTLRVGDRAAAVIKASDVIVGK